MVKLPGLAEESVFTSTDPAHVPPRGGLLRRARRPGARAGAGVPPLHDRSRDEPVRARDGRPRRPPGGRPGEGHGDRRRRAGRRRPGRLARHLVGQGPRAGRARASPSASATRSTRRCSRRCSPRGGRSSARSSRIPDAIQEVGPRLDRRHAGPPRRPRHGADHDVPRRLAGRQPALRARRLGGGPRLPAHRHRPGAPTTWPTSSPRASTGPTPPQHEKALFDRWIRGRRGRRSRRPRTTPPPGTTTARPPSSASSTPWSPGGAWTPATPARSTWPPPCSTASTGPSKSSTSPASAG